MADRSIKVHYRLIHQQNIYFSKKKGNTRKRKQNTVESLLSTAERNPSSPLSCRSQRRLLTTFPRRIFNFGAQHTLVIPPHHPESHPLPPALPHSREKHSRGEQRRREKEKGKDKSEQHLWLFGAGRVVSCVCAVVLLLLLSRRSGKQQSGRSR